MKVVERYPIDFVVTWVDDSDKKWQMEKLKYLLAEGKPVKSEEDGRYRDWRLFPYWFRAVEKYAPWVRKVYLVLSDSNPIPNWLDIQNPKLFIIRHSDIIEDRHLPTFSSHVIEWNLHKIKGLSEHFVYFNDDMYITDFAKKEDFFKNGKVRDAFIMTAIQPKDQFSNILANNIRVINKYFNKKEFLKKHWKKVFSLKYGRLLLKSCLVFPWPDFTGFHNLHNAYSLKRSAMEMLWGLERPLLEKVCSHRFRNKEDVNLYLVSQYLMLTNDFEPRHVSDTAHYEMEEFKGFEKELKKRKRKLMVLNDNETVQDFEGIRRSLQQTFQEVFPEKSSYEV